MKTILLIIFSAILAISFISAWGPDTHFAITSDCLNESTTLIKDIIMANLDACYAGLEYADVGIFYYYTDFKEYAGLHDYTVVDEMLRIATNDRQRAFAYCWKIHLSEDAISHNYFVPEAIKRTKLPNYVIHAIQELKIEGHYLNPVANRLMEKHAEFDSFVTKATGKDWSVDAGKLNAIMGGGNFYADGYKPESTTWFGKTQNAIYKVIATFVSEKTSIDYYRLSEESCVAVLRGETSELDPSGESALDSADQSTTIWLYIGTFVIFIIILIVLWRFKWI